MTYKVSDWAWGLDLPPVEKLTMVAFADLANAAGQCWPGQALLASMTGTSDRTMRRVLITLEEKRLITRSHRYLPNGRRTSDLVTVAFAAEPQDNLAGSGFTTGQHAEGLPANTPGDYRPTVAGLVEPPVEPPENPQNARALERGDFDRFWSVYPRRVGKEAARKAYLKLARTFGGQTIIDGAERFAADPNLPPQQYVPHPATWLNRHGWEDEPLPVRGGGQSDWDAMMQRAQELDARDGQ